MRLGFARVFFAAVIIFSASALAGVEVYAMEFTDVPREHWAYESVYRLRDLGITDGVGGGRFGLDDPVTRAQFAGFLCRLYGWEDVTPSTATFTDVTSADWYYGFVETAARNGVFLESSGQFRPTDAITRGEMAVMLIRSLGFAELAGHITSSGFSDVTEHIGYIALARDFGIIGGIDATLTRYAPSGTATRGQAALMMVRAYDRHNSKTDFLNAFYAIRSAGQMDFINALDSVGFGWSRFEMHDGLVLNMTSANNNEYSVPAGYEQPLNMAKTKSALLMVTAADTRIEGITLTDYIVSNPNLHSVAIDAIMSAIEQYGFDGVVIDLEGMRGERLKAEFINFLTALRSRIPNKILHVAVHPASLPGLPYFDAYDYRAIGEIADKVILMAHDYHAKRMTEQEMAMNFTVTPLSPIDQVYYSLKAITDEQTGVRDRNKIVVQFSFDAVQWQSANRRVINSAAFMPTYDALVARIRNDGVINYSERYESPFVTYTSDDGTENIIWYEDSRSVAAKMRLSKMFGITGFSLWRLGTVPDYPAEIYLDVWNTVRVR